MIVRRNGHSREIEMGGVEHGYGQARKSNDIQYCVIELGRTEISFV